MPGLLVPDPPPGLALHIGTSDVDLALRVAALQDDGEFYRTLKSNLTNLGLKQGQPSFLWESKVEGKTIKVELFAPVQERGEAGKMQKKPIEQSGSGLTALGIFGLELMARDIEIVSDEGLLMNDLGRKRVELRVCGSAMLLALKAWALTERTKSKDGYDVVWMLKALEPQAVASRFRDADLHSTEFGIAALARLEENFATIEHTGPKGWTLGCGFDGTEAAREARDAVGLVREFVAKARS